MNLDDLERDWAEQTVIGATVPAADVTARFERELRSVRRRFTGMIVMAAGLLIFSWTLTIVAHLTGIKRLTPLEAIATVVGSGFYLGWLALAIRSRQAVRREAGMLGSTTRESAAASLRVVGLQISNYRVAAWSLPLAVGATAVLSFAKFNRGELHGWGGLAAIGFIALLAAIAGVAMWQRYCTELKPRREELQKLLGSIDAAE